MPKHHSKDYKLSAIKYFLKIDNKVKTCEIFKRPWNCPENQESSSFKNWINSMIDAEIK